MVMSSYVTWEKRRRFDLYLNANVIRLQLHMHYGLSFKPHPSNWRLVAHMNYTLFFFEIFFLFLHLILINKPCSNMLMARLFHKSTITFVSGNHCRLLTWNPSKGQNQEDQESKFLEIDLTNKVWFAILYSVYTYYTSS